MSKYVCFFQRVSSIEERCFYVESSLYLTGGEQEVLSQILGESIYRVSAILDGLSYVELQSKNVVEIGPRLNVVTPFSANALFITKVCGLQCITRIEQSARYVVDDDQDEIEFFVLHLDKITQQVYKHQLTSIVVIDIC